MVVAQREFDDPVAFELDNLPWHRLLEDVHVAEPPKTAVAPRIDHTICGHCAGITVAGLDSQRYLAVVMRLEWTRLQLVGHLDILRARLRGSCGPTSRAIRIRLVRSHFIEQILAHTQLLLLVASPDEQSRHFVRATP